MTSRGWTFLALAAAALTACGTPSSPQTSAEVAGDQDAPIVVSGRFVNGAGLPVMGARVSLQVLDDSDAQVGQPIPVVFSMDTRTSIEGSFAFRFRPPAPLKRFAASNSDFVNFQLMAVDEASGGMGLWTFPRQIVSDGWDGPPPSVTLRENGGSTSP